eukprot:29128-Pelagococcus_subviridis.AAC.4
MKPPRHQTTHQSHHFPPRRPPIERPSDRVRRVGRGASRGAGCVRRRAPRDDDGDAGGRDDGIRHDGRDADHDGDVRRPRGRRRAAHRRLGCVFCTLVPVRPRRRGERRSLRTFSPGDALRPPLGFDPRPRCLSTPLLTPFNSTPTFARTSQSTTAARRDPRTTRPSTTRSARRRRRR